MSTPSEFDPNPRPSEPERVFYPDGVLVIYEDGFSGFYQWDLPRRTAALRDFAQGRGLVPTSLAAQLAFVKAELLAGDPDADSAAEMASLWGDYYKYKEATEAGDGQAEAVPANSEMRRTAAAEYAERILGLTDKNARIGDTDEPHTESEKENK